MPKTKKDEFISIRLPEKTKQLMQLEANRHYRKLNDEAVVLITEALHNRNYNINDYV